jgi:hypothetical protein
VHDPDDLRDYPLFVELAARRRGAKERNAAAAAGRKRGERREQYAEAIARAEFGRFYWNGKRRGELGAA